MPFRLAAAWFCLFCCLTICPQARADDTDTSVIIERYLQHFVVNDDGSYVLTVDNTKTIAEQKAVQAHSQYYISYNASLDSIAEISGYTLKADGRRLPVPPEQIRDQHESASSEAPMFQDTRMKIVVFSDVAPGDRVVVHYVLTRHTPLFAGHFEDLSSSQFVVNRQFQLIYDLPASMPLHADAVGFAAQPIASPPGRQRYRWQYVDGPNQRIEAGSVSYLDYGKRLAVSTFPDYAAFARAYQQAAHEKAAPDPAIVQLSHQLTRDLTDARAKALALSDWVRRNVRYVAAYIGAGGVVPHAAATVLRNRYGDCKDHAILLEALLRAAGIDSSAALVNNGDAYRLPRVPTLGIFNHVITYVAQLDLYLDPTAESIAAGYLPTALLGKPVLLTRSGQLASTPSRQLEKNRTVSHFEVHKNGRSSFTVSKRTSGAIAEPYRQAVRDTGPAERASMVRHMLQSLGQRGEGVLEAATEPEEGDDYRIGFRGVSENFAALPGPTGLATAYDLWGGLKDAVAGLAQEARRSQDFACPSINSAETSHFAFGKGVRILALPKPVTLHAPDVFYQARYTRQANLVTVRRQLYFEHEGIVCHPADYLRLQPLLARLAGDLKSQIIIKAD